MFVRSSGGAVVLLGHGERGQLFIYSFRPLVSEVREPIADGNICLELTQSHERHCLGGEESSHIVMKAFASRLLDADSTVTRFSEVSVDVLTLLPLSS